MNTLQKLKIVGVFALLFLSCAASAAKLVYSDAVLLSGSSSTCSTPSDTSCRRGLSGMMQIVRRLRTAGDLVTAIPTLDRQTPFVQQHPLSWGVNAEFYSRYGVTHYITTHALFTEPDRSGWERLRGASVARPLLSNVLISPADLWFGVVDRAVIENRLGIVVFGSDNEPNSVNSISVAATTIKYLRSQSTVDVVVVMTSESTGDRAPAAFVAALAAQNAKPDVMVFFEEDYAPAVENGTMYVGAGRSGSRVAVVDISHTGKTVTNVTLEEVSINMDTAQRDATWVADQQWNNVQATLAETNNPIVGYTTVMPFTREGDFRMCMGGECPLGALFTNAMRWKANSDIAFTPSGGTRGPGWAAGPVRVSDIWAALPFANRVCTGKILGFKLWQMLNYSYGVSTFSTINADFGDRLLQVAGMRVSYNPDLNGTRLQSIEILNRATNMYEPLERTKVYSFASDSFLCAAFSPYPDYLAPRYAVENPKWTLGTRTLQEVVPEFLTATTTSASPYNTAIEGRMIDSTNATSNPDPAKYTATAAVLDLTETPETCPADHYWDASLDSCIACAEGFTVPSQGATVCVPKPEPASQTGIIAGSSIGGVFVLAALCFAILMWYRGSKNVRNVANAPKSGKVALMFTDIQSSTKLWSTCPASMAVALDTHHALIREAITEHKAYEVKTVGDAFMIAVSSAPKAIKIANDIQLKLHAAQFPFAISKVYAAETEEDLEFIDDDPEDLVVNDDPNWNGVRVRIGIHIGEPDIVYDEIAKGYDYYGPPSNVAARVESVGDGGQVTLTRDVEKDLGVGEAEGMVITPLTSVELKGVNGKTEILQMVPTSLNGRKFKELASADEAEGDEMSDQQSVGSVLSMAVADENVVNAQRTVHQIVKIMTPKDKKAWMDLTVKTWRVQTTGRSEVQLLDAIGRRVGRSMKKSMMVESLNNGVHPFSNNEELAGSTRSGGPNSGRRASHSGRRKSSVAQDKEEKITVVSASPETPEDPDLVKSIN